MGKAEAGTPKAIANAMKAKGLQRLRWYCQVCEKQCRDENGFKCHTQSESHLRQMLVVGENAGKHIEDFSSRFQSEFVGLLSRRFGTKRIRANQVYQEYISDRNHLHMNATRWVTLTEFVKHLGRTGVAHVDETEKGWYIAWIDNSPKALARQEAVMKKERQDMDDEQRQRKLLAEQIERARREEEAKAGSASTSAEPPRPIGLERAEGDQPIKLSFSLSKPPSPPTAPGSGSTSPAPSAAPAPAAAVPTKISITPAANPLKKPGNVFKAAAAAKPKPAASASAPAPAKTGSAPKSNVEALMLQDQAWKKRKEEGAGGAPAKRLKL